MHHLPPSTPQRSHSSPSNVRSPLSRNATPAPTGSRTSVVPKTPSLASQAQVLSFSYPGLTALPEPPFFSGVALSWLAEHIPLHQTPESESVLAALIASRATLARSHRQQQATTNYGLSWDWYIKDVSRRKLTYDQITNVLIGLVRACAGLSAFESRLTFCPHQCSLLELTTDSAIFLYCARPERGTNYRERGRHEVSYVNTRALQNTESSGLHTNLLTTAERLGDVLARDWTARQNIYDKTSRPTATQVMRNGGSAHSPGDFPLLSRFDGQTADALVHSIAQLDWLSFGIAPPSLVTAASPGPSSLSSSRQSFAQSPSRRHEAPAADWAATFSEFEIGDFESSEESEEDGVDSDTSANTFIGRRIRPSERKVMKTLGLTKLQRVQVRLMLWEVESDGWYERLKPMFRANNQALFTLLGALAS
ncbi:hypothetical protein M407DRAFT_7574 [Tulasnella calospora MUT 4182]|uniref:Uncharacterized protein n=1 Tax=Tulasnella calospora MUT 4182 TaxID=1051891 RepID=A0A0C3QKG9_9AGAM|nr:hypothetical protein M407DRAFT_7574 [Tulasnella calospora MUT 4182]